MRRAERSTHAIKLVQIPTFLGLKLKGVPPSMWWGRSLWPGVDVVVDRKERGWKAMLVVLNGVERVEMMRASGRTEHEALRRLEKKLRRFFNKLQSAFMDFGRKLHAALRLV